jgi:hypothetical protein
MIVPGMSCFMRRSFNPIAELSQAYRLHRLLN